MTEEIKNQNAQQEPLEPREYFDIIKSKKQNITNEDLIGIYKNCEVLANKYITTDQVSGLRKLIFYMETVAKEIDIVNMGINTFIYRDDIENYIDNISKDVVKLTELKDYEREIPDSIIDTISKVKDKFDKLYVVFTDYTGKEERKVEKKRRDKDPILFGTFQDKVSKVINDRFYFLADWEDEYCDLTFDKMISDFENKGKPDPTRSIIVPQSIDELKGVLSTLEKKINSKSGGFATTGFVQTNNIQAGVLMVEGSPIIKPNKKSFFSNVKTFFSRKSK